MTLSPAPLRTFPESIRRTLLEAAEARRHQLDTLPPFADHDVVAAAHRGSVERILGDIQDAVARLDAGTYGDCRECRRPIALQRLTQRPWATVCAWCV